MNVWPPVPQVRGRGRGRGIVNSTTIPSAARPHNEPGSESDPVDPDIENTELKIGTSVQQTDGAVVTPPISETVAAPQPKIFTIDMSVEPPPIPLIFDPEVASKKPEDDEYGEVQYTIDEPEPECTVNAGESVKNSGEIGDVSVVTEPGQGGSQPSEPEAVWEDTDEKEHRIRIVPGLIAPKMVKSRPTSGASSTSTSSEISKNKNARMDADMHEEVGNWIADPRLRKRMAQQRVARIEPSMVTTAVEEVKVIEQNVDTPVDTQEMTDSSELPSNTSTGVNTTRSTQNVTQMCVSQNKLQNGHCTDDKENGFFLDKHRFGYEVGITDQGKVGQALRAFRNRQLRSRRRGQLPDSGNKLVNGSTPEVMDVEVPADEGDESTVNEGDEISSFKLFPKLIFKPYVCPRNPRGLKFGMDILKELAAEYGIELKYNYELLEDSEDPNGPIRVKATIQAGFREGVGICGTRMEAKNEAAENCLRDLKFHNPGLDISLDFKKWTKTDPAGDILYVLSRTCMEYGMAAPEYEFEVDGLGHFTFTCQVGNITATATASKKRVARRLAAIEMYKTFEM